MIYRLLWSVGFVCRLSIVIVLWWQVCGVVASSVWYGVCLSRGILIVYRVDWGQVVCVFGEDTFVCVCLFLLSMWVCTVGDFKRVACDTYVRFSKIYTITKFIIHYFWMKHIVNVRFDMYKNEWHDKYMYLLNMSRQKSMFMK